MKKKILIFIFLIVLLNGCSSKKIISTADSLEMNSFNEYGYVNNASVSKVEQNTESKIIVSGYLNMETKNFDETLSRIEQNISKIGGYIQSSNIYNNYTGGRSLNATIRIPSEEYDGFIESLKSFGNVTNYSYTAEDITTTYYDSQAKLISLEAEYKKGLDFYSKAETVQDLMDVEKYLSNIQYEIDSLKSEIKNYDLLTNYSTLDLNVVETEILTNTEENFSAKVNNAFMEGLQNFKLMMQNFIVMAAYNFWLLVALLVAIALIYIVFRKNKKKKSKRNNSHTKSDEVK